MPARNAVSNPVMDWVGVELVEDTVYLVVELEWRARREFGGVDLNLPVRVHATGSLHLSEEGWRTFGIALASGGDPVRMFEGAWQITWREGFEFADLERADVTAEVKVAAAGVFELPNEVVRMSLPPFLLRRMGGIERVEQAVTAVTRLNFDEALMYREYYRAFLEMGPFRDEQGREVLCVLRVAVNTRPGVPQISDETMRRVIRREVCRGETYIDDLYRLYEQQEEATAPEELGKMATEEETDNRKSEGEPGLGGSAAQSEGGQKYRESTNPDGTKGNRKEISTGESSGKVGGSRQGTQGTKEGRNKDRTSPRNSEGAMPKKVRVTDTRRKLAEIDKRTAEYKARLIEEMVTGNEEGPLQEEPRDERKASQGRDIMAIVAARRSWKETRDVMMRKYLVAEKMATEADLVAVQRKNFAMYNDFIREFTLVALRIPGVTDRIMSKYFLRQFFEFDKDKILSAYQQTSKFVNTRDVGFSTVTDLAEKTVVTETLALLKEGEIIDLTGRTGDKVKKGIESLHERVHGVDNKIERMEGALLVMQAQVSRPVLPPQEAVVPPGVANGHYVRACPKLNHDIMKRRCTRSLKGEIFGPQGERVNWNSPGGMRRAIIMLNRLEITVVEAEPVGEIIWDQLRGRGPQANFILESDGRDRASPRLLKGLRQLLTRRRVEIGDNPELPEGEREEEASQEVANLQRSHGDLKDIEKAFADIRLSLPDREGGEVMRSPPGTKLSFHALPVGKLKIQIGSHHTDALKITGCTVNKEVTGSIRGAGGEIPFAVTKCAVKAGVRESIWSFQRMTVMEEMDHDIILGRPWCAKVEMIGMHLHDGSYMVDKEDPVTGRGELLRLLGTGGDPAKGKLATWSPSFEDSTLKRAFARMEGYDQLPLDVRDRPYTAMHTPVGQLQMQVTPMGFTNVVAEAQRRMLAVAGDMFPEKCEPYIDDNPIKGAQEKDETEIQPGIRRFMWDHLQDIKDLLRRFLVYNITASGPKSILAVPEVTILGFRCGAYDRKPDPAKTDKISQWPTPLRTTTEAYLFGRRFILRIDPTNVAVALKNYRPIDPTVGRWVGFIWQFDYKIERIAGIRNKADGLSRVCITPEGMEDAEPIDAFLEYEGGTLAVDNEVMSGGCTSGELLIQTLEKGAPAVVAELREGPVTTRGRREENDSWGAIVGPKEELMAMAVEGGREAVMSLVESWERKELQWVVNQMQEGKDGGQEGEEFLYVQSYEGLFREIGLLLVGNKQPTEVSIKAREEAERTTGCIPTELWYGREIDFPVEALVPTWNRLDDNPQMTTEELIEARCQQILKNEEVMEDIANRVLDNRMRDKAR
ncbi:hypothetical protein CBR_g41610 [Chara braunii]|uniref:Uncharacterized protein n=1 Tax=Chara braunii TaxID=69332 RepID=A0A388LW42_CHABU|nr:hypothetical protein CBR_g41610 [Chara braunii]|eukprot:GBG86547.1 hypothetical protein CBR_g41610 [Chara braunii]